MPLNPSFLNFKVKFDNKIVTVRLQIIKLVVCSILCLLTGGFGTYLDDNYSVRTLEYLAMSFYMTSLVLIPFCFTFALSIFCAYTDYQDSLIIDKDVDLNDEDDSEELDDKEDIDALVEEQPKKIYYICSHCGNKVYDNLSKDYFNFGQSCPLCGNIMKEVNEETN